MAGIPKSPWKTRWPSWPIETYRNQSPSGVSWDVAAFFWRFNLPTDGSIICMNRDEYFMFFFDWIDDIDDQIGDQIDDQIDDQF